MLTPARPPVYAFCSDHRALRRTAAMPQFNDRELTAAVIRSFDETPEPRAKLLLQELVKSLHDFVRKTDRSFDEWGYAIDFLPGPGQKCSQSRQEFSRLSDVLWVSMLVDG